MRRRRPPSSTAAAPLARAVAFLITVAAVAVVAPVARAANGTWISDTDANNGWSISGNWSGGTVADGVDFTANFTNDITATRTVTLDTARTIGNLTFSDNAAAGSSWVLSGPNTLTLDRTSGTPTITATTNVKISTVLAGNKGLTKIGTGVLELTGANTYSGTTTISQGDLRAIDGVGLPSGSTLALAGFAATFQSSGTFTRALGTGAGQVRFNTTGGGFSAFGGPLAVQIGGNTNTLTWNSTPNFLSLSSSLVLSSATADSLVDFQNGLDLNAGTRPVIVVDNASLKSDLAMISGPISGSTGTLNKQATGTLILTGANSYGATTISNSGGTLQIGNGGTTGTLGTGNVTVGLATTLAFNRSDALSITNTFVSNTSSIAQNGTGTTTLSGDMSLSSAGVQVNRGTLVLDYGTFNTTKVGNSAVLTIGTAALQLAGGTHQEVVGSTTINGAASISRSSGAATLRLNAITIASGASLDLSINSLADTDTLNTNGILPGVTVGGQLAKNSTNAGDGAIVALVAGDYTQVNRLGGAIVNGAASNVKIVSGGTIGNVTVAPAVTSTVNTLSQGATDGNAVVDIGALGTLRLGATGSVLVPSGSNALTINGGTLTAGGADNTAGLLLFLNAGNDVTVNSAIADNGTGAVGVSKSGAGVLTLATANSHTGKTAVNGGTLVIADENRLGSNPAALAADQLSINGATLRTTATFSIDDANRGVTLGSGGGTFQTDPGTTLTVASAIAGTNAQSALTKTGAGTLVLTGGSSYTGGTTVSGGTLRVDGSLPSGGAVAVGAAGTLGGHGSVGAVGGAGLVSPGNGPGVLTAPQADGSGGLRFAFELTRTGSPTYANAAASGNDVLHLTGAAPFAVALGGGNVIDVYLDVATLADGDRYHGGFYADQGGDFTAALAGATLRYHVQDVTGTEQFEGVAYSPVSADAFTIAAAAVPESADFASGTQSGYVSEFTVTAVPEPSAAGLLAGGAAALLLARRRARPHAAP